MANSSLALTVTCVVLLCMFAIAPIAQAAVTCGQVASAVAPCINYVRGVGPLTPPCCAGIRSLNVAAKTTPDRRQACNCLKSLNNGIRRVNYGLAGGLPGKCGVNIPYKISPSINCNTVN